MNNSFEYITSLQYKLKAAEALNAAFMNGKKYIQMTEQFSKRENFYKKQLHKSTAIIAQLRADIIDIRNQWFEVFEDMGKKFNKKITMLRKQLKEMEKCALKTERQRDELNAAVKKQTKDIETLETEYKAEVYRNTKTGEVLYSARANKGHEGVKGTPVEDYQGILYMITKKHFTDMIQCTRNVFRMYRDI